eukprot:CAMPEP_0172651960 /NCGR_PEP_ID=MMETSP1068-20121228/243075_1 /TAXON_ID=35684 /ORGANISM="Pseudopedinella elastica, Strain CCMP716" /LENGTH=211 /DNA_ID=CAMNT_0013466365 /DNA_START=529 /DNA_END=1165 /DNA_ORIENTATION=-
MAMFTEYEEEVTNCLATSKAAGPSTQQGASSLAEAKDMLQQMKLEMRTMFGEEKKEAAKTIQRLEAQVAEAEAAELMGANPLQGGSQNNTGGAEERARATAATARLEASSARLARTRDLVAEMEETGSDILGTLGENREKIDSAHAKVKAAKGEIDKADKIQAAWESGMPGGDLARLLPRQRKQQQARCRDFIAIRAAGFERVRPAVRLSL